MAEDKYSEDWKQCFDCGAVIQDGTPFFHGMTEGGSVRFCSKDCKERDAAKHRGELTEETNTGQTSPHRSSTTPADQRAVLALIQLRVDALNSEINGLRETIADKEHERDLLLKGARKVTEGWT